MFEECLKNVFPDSSNVEKLTLLTKKRSEERFLNKSECLSLSYFRAGEGVGVGVTENKDALYVVIFLW